MKVIVNSTQVTSRQRQGKSPLYFQQVMFERGDGAVYPTDILLSSPENAHKVGTYSLSHDSFSTGEYGKIIFRPLPGQLLATATAKAA